MCTSTLWSDQAYWPKSQNKLKSKQAKVKRLDFVGNVVGTNLQSPHNELGLAIVV
jgi:hypothetical protein